MKVLLKFECYMHLRISLKDSKDVTILCVAGLKDSTNVVILYVMTKNVCYLQDHVKQHYMR